MLDHAALPLLPDAAALASIAARAWELLGEALAALAEGDRVLRLGFSGIRDYARERLGIGGTAAQRGSSGSPASCA